MCVAAHWFSHSSDSSMQVNKLVPQRPCRTGNTGEDGNLRLLLGKQEAAVTTSCFRETSREQWCMGEPSVAPVQPSRGATMQPSVSEEQRGADTGFFPFTLLRSLTSIELNIYAWCRNTVICCFLLKMMVGIGEERESLKVSAACVF